MGLATMIFASSQAVTKDVGLIATFGGIGLLVNIILVYVAIQIRGERRQNQAVHGLAPVLQRRLTPSAHRRAATSAQASTTTPSDSAASAPSSGSSSVARESASVLPSERSRTPPTALVRRRSSRAGRAQPPLRDAQSQAGPRAQQSRERDPLRVHEVADEGREGAQPSANQQIAVQPPAEELEVVRRQEQRAHHDQRRQPGRHRDRPRDPDRERAREAHRGERDQRAIGQPRGPAGGRAARRARAPRPPPPARTPPAPQSRRLTYRCGASAAPIAK